MLAILTASTSCRRAAPPPPALTTTSPYPELKLIPATYPRVDGSTSTEPLQRIIACEILAAPYEWGHSENNDTRYLVATDIYESFENENYQGEKKALCAFINGATEHHGTHEAYVRLIEKEVDMILVAREPSSNELRLAKNAQVVLDFKPVALDAFVFLLSGENPINNLTLTQIRDIYSGRITNWKQLGGRNAPIHPYQRNRNSGSQELMQSLVMKDRKLIDSPDLLTGTIMSHPFLAISEDPLGIGYSVYFYEAFMAPRTDVKTIAVDGVEPTSTNIRSHRYPLTTEVYMVVRNDLAAESAARRIHDWLLEPEGQSVVEKSGYVPVDASADISADAPQN